MAGGGIRASGSDELPLNAEINVTSLTDVTLVLLIIFMLTAPLMQGGVEVQLPRAEARPITPGEGVMVTVDRAGALFIDDTPVREADFRVAFRALVATRRPEAVYVRADGRASYAAVARVLAVVRASGVRNVGLVTDEEVTPP